MICGIGSKLDTASLAQALRDHPDIAAELAVRLQMEPDLAAELGLLPPQRERPLLAPPSCPQLSPEGVACRPGLAYSTITQACEWPDTLMESGCNPEGIKTSNKNSQKIVFQLSRGSERAPRTHETHI